MLAHIAAQKPAAPFCKQILHCSCSSYQHVWVQPQGFKSWSFLPFLTWPLEQDYPFHVLHVLYDLSTNKAYRLQPFRWFYTECAWALLFVLQLHTDRLKFTCCPAIFSSCKKQTETPQIWFPPPSQNDIYFDNSLHTFHIFIRFYCYMVRFVVFCSVSSLPLPSFCKCLVPLKTWA